MEACKLSYWTRLIEWYGGDVAIPRIASKGRYQFHESEADISLDLHPLYLKFVKSSDLESEKVVAMSKHDTIGALKKRACEEIGLDPNDVRIWDYFHKKKYALLENMTKTLGDAQIHDNNGMLLENLTIPKYLYLCSCAKTGKN
jgi:ubiquitin carboxyl-terminal hydrolase 4/11/15